MIAAPYPWTSPSPPHWLCPPIQYAGPSSPPCVPHPLPCTPMTQGTYSSPCSYPSYPQYPGSPPFYNHTPSIPPAYQTPAESESRRRALSAPPAPIAVFPPSTPSTTREMRTLSLTELPTMPCYTPSSVSYVVPPNTDRLYIQSPVPPRTQITLPPIPSSGASQSTEIIYCQDQVPYCYFTDPTSPSTAAPTTATASLTSPPHSGSDGSNLPTNLFGGDTAAASVNPPSNYATTTQPNTPTAPRTPLQGTSSGLESPGKGKGTGKGTGKGEGKGEGKGKGIGKGKGLNGGKGFGPVGRGKGEHPLPGAQIFSSPPNVRPALPPEMDHFWTDGPYIVQRMFDRMSQDNAALRSEVRRLSTQMAAVQGELQLMKGKGTTSGGIGAAR